MGAGLLALPLCLAFAHPLPGAYAVAASADAKQDKKAAKKAKKQAKKDKRTKRRSFPHRGFILEASGGPFGCVGKVCRDNLDAGTGGTVGAMIAGNLFGFVELGAVANWGGLKLRPDEGSNPLTLHGVDPVGFAQIAAAPDDAVSQIESRLSSLSVGEGKGRVLNAGATLRVHFLPYGRWAAYVGLGAQFHRWRAIFDTPEGEVDVRMPGLSVPLLLGAGYYVLRFMAINAQFHYTYVVYPQIRLKIDGFDGRAGREALEERDADLLSFGKNMPQYWAFLIGLKFRL